MTPGSVAARVAGSARSSGSHRLDIEHPTGFFTVELDVSVDGNGIRVSRAALLRTARKLFEGNVFVPSAAWDAAP